MGPISKPFYYGGHAAGVGGEVGCVDLPDVAQADNLGVTPGAGDQLFKHGHRDNHIVLIKMIERSGVVDQDIPLVDGNIDTGRRTLRLVQQFLTAWNAFGIFATP